MIRRSEVSMAALKKEMDLKKNSIKPQASVKNPGARFRVFGEELIQKEVKASGNSGRIYLPLDWVGKRVKVIRID